MKIHKLIGIRQSSGISLNSNKIPAEVALLLRLGIERRLHLPLFGIRCGLCCHERGSTGTQHLSQKLLQKSFSMGILELLLHPLEKEVAEEDNMFFLLFASPGRAAGRNDFQRH